MTNAESWSSKQALNYFDGCRNTTNDIYPSEWFFIKDCLKEGMSVLDIGCAQGGFSKVLSENLTAFKYTGVDISLEMIEYARRKNPQHLFYHISEGDYSILRNQQYDLVLILGILHLHEAWKKTVINAWPHVGSTLILDLRETSAVTVEDKSKSYFTMMIDDGVDAKRDQLVLPYNVINTSEALAFIESACDQYKTISRYGYFLPASSYANIPFEQVMMNVYCIQKGLPI